jgi:hypothetical protein
LLPRVNVSIARLHVFLKENRASKRKSSVSTPAAPGRTSMEDTKGSISNKAPSLDFVDRIRMLVLDGVFCFCLVVFRRERSELCFV